MIEIALTRGKIALIDDADHDLVLQYTWCAQRIRKRWYAVTGTGGQFVSMHRVIMNASTGEQIDHRNGDGLDNRRENLRFCTSAQQAYNKGPQPYKRHSQFKGVTWAARSQKWKAQIMQDGVNYHLGLFDREEDAADAYRTAAIERFGEFARF